MEVTVISQEHIGPSSPLPDHLKPFNLCLLDQLSPSAHSPIIFYYLSNIDTDHLKKFLSDTLTHFYPLAGKIKDNVSLDGINEGAFFAEARVNCSLRELLSCPDHILLRKLLPCELVPRTDVGTRMINIQVNRFKCGGTAVALCVSHKIVDGGVLSAFVKGWSAMARGDDSFKAPDLSAASVFPADGVWPGNSTRSLPRRVGKCTTKRFTFGSSAIATLKDQVISSLDIKYPSRVEVISAFVWKRAMAASQKLNNDEPNSSILLLAVNLRRRMKPPMPENSLGNFASVATACCEKDDPDKSLAGLTSKVRKSVQELQSHFVGPSRVRDVIGQIDKTTELGNEIKSRGEVMDGLLIASWCKFGYHEIDFGWGKPAWVSLVGYDSKEVLNFAILIDTMDGNGIEAWITLDEKEMIALEEDEEMGKYAALNPSPLRFDDGSSAK